MDDFGGGGEGARIGTSSKTGTGLDDDEAAAESSGGISLSLIGAPLLTD